MIENRLPGGATGRCCAPAAPDFRRRRPQLADPASAKDWLLEQELLSMSI
jgi:hypothetical protein